MTRFVQLALLSTDGDRIALVALAVESPEDGVRSMVRTLSPEIRWGIADAATAQGFGDITAVPTLFLFDREGKTAKVLYGAPPDLHDEVGKAFAALVAK